jgi:hypothetical protein
LVAQKKIAKSFFVVAEVTLGYVAALIIILIIGLKAFASPVSFPNWNKPRQPLAETVKRADWSYSKRHSQQDENLNHL